MNKKNIVLVAAGIIILIVIVGVVLTQNSHLVNNFPEGAVGTTNPSANTTQPQNGETGKSIYSEAFRTKARNDFINVCKNKIGDKNEAVCLCVADNLGANYSDIQLGRMYLQYRSANVIPDEITKAYETCKK